MAQAQTPAKRAVIETTTALHEAMFPLSLPEGTLSLDCATGDIAVVELGKLTPEILAQAALHGLKQKLVDAAAISRNPDTGKPATPEDKWAAVMEVFNRITGSAPTWNKTREGGTGGSGGLLFRALCRLYPAKTPDALREYLDGKTEPEKTALRKNPRVAKVIEDIRLEMGKASDVDTDEMLSELGEAMFPGDRRGGLRD